MGITLQHVEESLCAAHVTAIAGMAGAALGLNHLHDYGVDGQFEPIVERKVSAKKTRKVISGFPLPFQAKATINWTLKDNKIIYDLESKSYNDIVLRTEAEATLLLVLLCLPKNKVDWHDVSSTGTMLRNCCYWQVIRGQPVINEKSTKRVFIPDVQLLTPSSLNDLLEAEKLRREAQVR